MVLSLAPPVTTDGLAGSPDSRNFSMASLLGKIFLGELLQQFDGLVSANEAVAVGLPDVTGRFESLQQEVRPSALAQDRQVSLEAQAKMALQLVQCCDRIVRALKQLIG